jgi:hypothetical protein
MSDSDPSSTYFHLDCLQQSINKRRRRRTTTTTTTNSTMKFSTITVSTATAAIAFFGAPVSVSARKKHSKSGCSSSSSLEPYCYSPPADFEGIYIPCFATVIRDSASKSGDGTYHLCEGDLIHLSSQNFTKTDDFGAYVSTSVGVLEDPPVIDLGSFQGIANGNTLSMAAFGDGLYLFLTGAEPENVTQDLIPNNSPDRKICTMYAGNVMECTYFFTEYCSGVTEGGENPCDEGQQWLNTYAVEAISVLDGETCPDAPKTFCETKKPGPPTRRGLQDEGESSKKTPCPFLAGKMDD